jgi:hypothetical protein
MTPTEAAPAKAKSEFFPGELFVKETLWHETIRAKLSGLLESNQFRNFEQCGHAPLFRTCLTCGQVKTMTYRCSIKWCPLCNWQITRKRAAILKAWSEKIAGGKHVVLTQRNFSILTRRKLREHQRALAKMRRKKVFASVRGGCCSVEITNEGQGWHLHSHWLVDSDFLDPGQIAVEWGKLVGQDYGIVKVKDARAKDYAHEVAKYVVKGSDMASWPAEQILEFVTAIKGVRFFFTFGTLTKMRAEIESVLDGLKKDPAICECGCGRFKFESLEQSVCNEVRQSKRRK